MSGPDTLRPPNRGQDLLEKTSVSAENAPRRRSRNQNLLARTCATTEKAPGRVLFPAAILVWLLLAHLFSPPGAPADPEPAAAGRQERPAGKLFSAAFVSEGRAVAVGERGKILLSEDGGTSWIGIRSGTRKALFAAGFPDDRHGWIVGQAGLILHSADSGRSWAAQPAGVPGDLLAVDFIDAENGIAAGTEATVLTTADGGRTWRRSTVGPLLDAGEEFAFFAVLMLDRNRACAAGDGGRIFLTADAGRSWTEAASPLYDPETMSGRVLYDLAADSGTLHAVGIDATYVFSRDQGLTWTEGRTGLDGPELYCLDFVDGFGMAAGSGGIVAQSRDGGSTWFPVEVPDRVLRDWLSGMDLRKDGSGRPLGLIVGQNGALGRLREGALAW